MWNDTEVPLAYLFTFRTYGSWLHGDERGSINRFRNRFKTNYLPPEPQWFDRNISKLKCPPVKLDAAMRTSVEKAIRECCDHREWLLYGINVRTNHVHLVAAIGNTKSANALGAFKANATRELRDKNLWKFEHSPWVDKGSVRNLWNQEHVSKAVSYVLFGQGNDLPKFLDE